MARLKMFTGGGARLMSGRQVRTLPKPVDATYRCSSYREWRQLVFARAGGRCEVVEDGQRCSRAAPDYRMYADHVVEIRDGGERFDPANGRLKCASHHVRKTAAARANRR